MAYDPILDAAGVCEVLRLTLPLYPASEERNRAWDMLDHAANYLWAQAHEEYLKSRATEDERTP